MNKNSARITRNGVEYVFWLVPENEISVQMHNDALNVSFLLSAGVSKKDIESLSAIASDNWANFVNIETANKPNQKGIIELKMADFAQIKAGAQRCVIAANEVLKSSKYQLLTQVCELIDIYTTCEGVNPITKRELILGAPMEFIVFFLKELKKQLSVLMQFHFKDMDICLEIAEAVVGEMQALEKQHQ